MLAATLATTLAGWWIVRRYNGTDFRLEQLPKRFLSLRVAVGLTVILLGSLVFFEIGTGSA